MNMLGPFKRNSSKREEIVSQDCSLTVEGGIWETENEMFSGKDSIW